MKALEIIFKTEISLVGAKCCIHPYILLQLLVLDHSVYRMKMPVVSLQSSYCRPIYSLNRQLMVECCSFFSLYTKDRRLTLS